jgi:site-specific recombinase XerD
MLISKGFALFLADRKVSGYTKKTLSFYNDSAGGLVRYVLATAGDIELSALHEWINPYFLRLQERRTNATTRHTYFRGIKTFVRFLHAEQLVDAPIRLPSIKCPDTAIRPLTPDQMRQILKSFKMETFTGLRNQVIMRLMFDTGMRLMEVASIATADLHLEEGYVLLKGKGQKERWVPFGTETGKAIWAYLKQRERFAAAGTSALFITHKSGSLTARGIQMIFKRLRKKINIEGVRLSPHTARHSFALAYISISTD